MALKRFPKGLPLTPDKDIMEFNLMHSWVAAGLGVVALVLMGVQNKRSGYQPERTDVVLSILMLWARMVGQPQAQSMSQASAAPAPAPAPKPEAAPRTAMVTDLLALQTALGRSNGVQARQPAVARTEELVTK